ncbi:MULTISPECIES: hypothetical protein [Rhodopirellula]|jgi:hypothetical protein|uniref:Putative secreted protein n=1 Tax=Rhodopirellula europaea 6C TaxID=1263867 RepID=M2B4U8_9BACT|nr:MULTISPECIES: hypothetical protein [Rhodopirellula]EMB16768.1 putative secreted protein [Rhodopirellula europaea 6C]MCR9209634.1 hypothetical protein [bacterium]|tara:strand:+ start:19295 stop:19603 length:309 start_codon:yes stop_codon:yes gene_type:complete
MTQLSLFDAIAPVSPVIASVSATAAPKSNGSDNSLLALAELIREGREQLESQRASTERPIQRIGDLAQAVLRRHDLVARRRAASQQKASDFDAADDNVQVAS